MKHRSLTRKLNGVQLGKHINVCIKLSLLEASIRIFFNFRNAFIGDLTNFVSFYKMMQNNYLWGTTYMNIYYNG